MAVLFNTQNHKTLKIKNGHLPVQETFASQSFFYKKTAGKPA